MSTVIIKSSSVSPDNLIGLVFFRITWVSFLSFRFIFIATTSESTLQSPDKTNPSAEKLERCPERTSILLFGSSGVGKSSVINHLLKPNESKLVAEAESSEQETRKTLEYVVTVDKPDDKTSDRTLQVGIIDTPGVNDPLGLKQDACNLYSVKRFFETHPLYSKTKCYPNLIFLLVSATDHRLEGSDSNLAHTLKILKELGVVDQHHPNVVAVSTFGCSVSDKTVSKPEEGQEEIDISRVISEALGFETPVVSLESDLIDFSEQEKVEDSSLLAEVEKQPENLYEACRQILQKNSDDDGLTSFNACFDSSEAQKQCEVDPHSIPATDSSKDNLSNDEENLLNVLKDGPNGGKSLLLFASIWLVGFLSD